MSANNIAAIVAAVAVFSCVVSTLALTFRVGRLVGTVTAMIAQGVTERGQLREDLGAVRSQIDRHEQWHMGPLPATGRKYPQ